MAWQLAGLSAAPAAMAKITVAKLLGRGSDLCCVVSLLLFVAAFKSRGYAFARRSAQLGTARGFVQAAAAATARFEPMPSAEQAVASMLFSACQVRPLLSPLAKTHSAGVGRPSLRF